MMTRYRLAALAASVLLVGNLTAYELIPSRGIGFGRTMLLSRPVATTLLNVPGDTLRPGDWLFEAGYNRRFELADLDHLFLAAARRVGRMTISLGGSQFGQADLYAEQLLKGSLAWHHKRWTVAGMLAAMQVQIGNGYGGLRAASAGLGLSFRSERFLVAVTADDLTRPRVIDYTRRQEPTYTIYGELAGQRAYAITLRAGFQKEQQPQFGLGQDIRLAERAFFFWGLSTAPIEYGGGIEIGLPKGSFTYATSLHPVLGFSHTLTWSFKPIRKKPGGRDEFE